MSEIWIVPREQAEIQLVGTCLVNPKILEEMSWILNQDNFRFRLTAEVFCAMVDLYARERTPNGSELAQVVSHRLDFPLQSVKEFLVCAARSVSDRHVYLPLVERLRSTAD